MNGNGGSAFAAAGLPEEKKVRHQRRSYIPSWMEDPSWLPFVELPQDYVMELASERNSIRGSRLFSVHVDRHGRNSFSSVAQQIEMSQNDSQDRLMTLLADAMKSITQSAPWDPPDCDRETRKAMLALLLRKFLDQSPDPGALGLFSRDGLRRAAQEDVGGELQHLYTSFTSTDPDAGDLYRRQENFKNPEVFEQFRTQCLEEVRQRIHALNYDMSRCEQNVEHAHTIWNDIHGSSRGDCFGGTIRLSLKNVRLAGVRLPSRVVAVWNLCHGNRIVSRATTPQRAVLRGDGSYEWSETGGCATLTIPRGASADFLAFSIVLELRSEKSGSCFCSAPREESVGHAMVTVDDALYQSVAAPDSPLRGQARRGSHDAKSGTEPFTEGDETARYHLSSVLMSSVDGATECNGKTDSKYRIEGAVVLCFMNCLNAEHNVRPPAVDVGDTLDTKRMAAGAMEVSGAWTRDHHAGFLRLVDILGDLDDLSTLILRAYCRRYLIHGELERVALLVAVCTRCNLNEKSSRELCTHALSSLVELRDDLTTVASQNLADLAMEELRTNAFDIILGLEDVAEEAQRAEGLLREMKQLTSIIMQGHDIDEAIEEELSKSIALLTVVLQKLDGRVLREHRRTMVRVTVTDLRIPELERLEDAARLRGKARYLYELIEQLMDKCKRAILFAVESHSEAVLDLANRRIERTVEEICGPLRNVLARLLACLVRSPDPDPLGDTLGLLVRTYGSLMGLVDVLDSDTRMHSVCAELCECFSSFLSYWFPLCEDHISTWTASIVTREELVPIIPGEVQFNQSPGLLLDLLHALLGVFARVLGWSDPSQHSIYIVHFFSLVRRMGEAFAEALVAHGRAATRVEEWLVCFVSLRRCQEVLREFGETEMQNQLLDAFGDQGQVLQHQRKVIAEQMRASTLEVEEELLVHMRQSLEKSMLSFLSCVVDSSLPTRMTMLPEGTKQSAEQLADYVREQLRLVTEYLSPELFALFFEEVAVRAYHMAMQKFMVECSSAPLTQSGVALMLQLLQALDEQLELDGGKLAETQDFTFRMRSRRVLAALLSESSPRLLEMANSGKLDSHETSLVKLVLGYRRDPMAKHYVKMALNA